MIEAVEEFLEFLSHLMLLLLDASLELLGIVWTINVVVA